VRLGTAIRLAKQGGDVLKYAQEFLEILLKGSLEVDALSGANVKYLFGDFELEAGSRILRSRITGAEVPLTSRAFDLLLLLVRQPNVAIGKRELIDAVWPDTVVEDGNLDQAVFVLRQALGERRGEHRYIKTIHRRGYQFTALVQVSGTSQESPLSVPAMQVTPTAPIRRPPFAFALAAAVIIVSGAVVAWVVLGSSAISPAPAGDQTIAVLPFRTAGDDDAQLLGESLTNLLQQRFTAITGLPVVTSGSAWTMRKSAARPREIGNSLHARYLLSGSVARTGQSLHVDVALIEAGSEARLWTQEFNRPVDEIAAVREAIVAQCARAMHFQPSVAHEAVKAPVNLDVYDLYSRGMRFMGANASVADTEKAIALFSRTTVLDPRFARGYLGVGQALMYNDGIRPTLTGAISPEIAARAGTALDRALELNPALAEAWIQRALLVDDPAKAEKMFRYGMRLAPNYSVGAMFFSGFLSLHDRAGEAIDVIERARRYDPRSAMLLWLEANAVMQTRSDVAASENMLRQAVMLEPDFAPATETLAISRRLWGGQFAETIRLLERHLDPDSGERAETAIAYLDVDDLDAALRVWYVPEDPPGFELMVLSQYRHDNRAAAAVARTKLGGPQLGLYEIAAEALRDDAIATGNYAPALKLFESSYAAHPWFGSQATMDHGFAIVYAHTLILAGQVARGRRLARELMVSLDADEIGRPPHWFARDRAALFELLGDDDRALEELAASQNLNQWSRWWYTGEIDPLYSHLRLDPRFQALAEKARKQRAQQRALVEEMRRKGEIPTRRAPSSRELPAARAG
jgi:DNA-binding winged helix-turn-helix (wHTH) protein/TolB-like protein